MTLPAPWTTPTLDRQVAAARAKASAWSSFQAGRGVGTDEAFGGEDTRSMNVFERWSHSYHTASAQGMPDLDAALFSVDPTADRATDLVGEPTSSRRGTQ